MSASQTSVLKDLVDKIPCGNLFWCTSYFYPIVSDAETCCWTWVMNEWSNHGKAIASYVITVPRKKDIERECVVKTIQRKTWSKRKKKELRMSRIEGERNIKEEWDKKRWEWKEIETNKPTGV